MLLLLLLFIVLPFVELLLLMQLAEYFGAWHTLGLVVLTGVIGATLAKLQGLRTIQRLQEEVAQGRMPTTALLDAGMILVAGALLVTPGVLTDIFGFSLLVPVCRRLYRGLAARYIKRHFKVTYVDATFQQTGDRVVDAEVIDVSPQRNSPDAERLETNSCDL